MQSKKIGLDLRLFGTEHGGIGRYCQQIFPRLLKLDAKNHYVLFINDPKTKQFFLDLNLLNIEIVETKARHYSLNEQLGFLRQLNKYNLDLVHFPNFNVPILYKKPFVVTIHDVVHHKLGGAKKSNWLHFFAYKKVIESAAKRAEAIITVSQAAKKDIVKTLAVDPGKIKVIYEAGSLNTEVNKEQILEVKNRYVLNKPYFLFVGVLERKKNLINLTRGFDYFLKKYNLDANLVIVGKTDPHYPDIKHQALDVKNSNRIIFTGQVEDLELSVLYAGAKAYVSASLYEGFGLPGVEALSYGLPLLVSNTEVFNEIYDNAAIYFNPLDPQDIAEKMNLLMKDEKFCNQLKQKSMNRSRLFSWDRAAEETVEIYKNILSS